jgi:hypothetical protein
MKTRKIKFIANAVKWFDRVNGNTYHSVRITKVSTGETIYCQFQYGYGSQYEYTALQAMYEKGWIDKKKYKADVNDYADKRPALYMYDRLENYPIVWSVREGLKRDCVANGKA